MLYYYYLMNSSELLYIFDNNIIIEKLSVGKMFDKINNIFFRCFYFTMVFENKLNRINGVRLLGLKKIVLNLFEAS